MACYRAEELIDRGLIPWGKAHGIRYAMLDLKSNNRDYIKDSLDFLTKNYDDLPDDLKYTKGVLQSWDSRVPLDAGESRTLYICLWFYLRLLGEDRELIARGTLKERIEHGFVCNNPEIVGWPEERLLMLGTTQDATAAYIFRNRRKVVNPPPKLALTYDTVEHWERRREQKKCWVPQRDDVLLRQAVSFVDILRTGKTDFAAREAEDAAYACAMDLVSTEDAARMFPSLVGHESDRTKSIGNTIRASDAGEPICSRDHRVIQAVALRQRGQGKTAAEIRSKIVHPEAIAKSWPQFFAYLEYTYSV